MASTRALRRGRFESLEQRQLLAGDVSVNVVDGNLMIEGDEFDNKIMITAGTEADTLVITGLDGTNLLEEGQPAVSEVTVAGVHGATVELGEGDDLIAIVGAELRGKIAIDTGAGEDRVLVGTGGDAAELVGQLPEDLAVEVRGSLRIDSGGDNDQISVDDAIVRGRLGINAGEGDDVVSLGAATDDDVSARLQSRGGVGVHLGDGDDELNVHQLSARGIVRVHGSMGDDTIDASRIHASAMLLLGGDGLDTLSLVELDVRRLGIHTGADHDSVDVRDSVFTALGVALGDGDDTLTTANLEARVARLHGGEGEDTLDVVGGNDFAHEVIRGFEIPPDVNTHGMSFARRPFARLLRRVH